MSFCFLSFFLTNDFIFFIDTTRVFFLTEIILGKCLWCLTLPFAGLWVFNADELLLDSDSFSTLCLSSSIVSIISSLLFTRETNSSIISFSRAFSWSVIESGALEMLIVYKACFIEIIMIWKLTCAIFFAFQIQVLRVSFLIGSIATLNNKLNLLFFNK